MTDEKDTEKFDKKNDAAICVLRLGYLHGTDVMFSDTYVEPDEIYFSNLYTSKNLNEEYREDLKLIKKLVEEHTLDHNINWTAISSELRKNEGFQTRKTEYYKSKRNAWLAKLEEISKDAQVVILLIADPNRQARCLDRKFASEKSDGNGVCIGNFVQFVTYEKRNWKFIQPTLYTSAFLDEGPGSAKDDMKNSPKDNLSENEKAWENWHWSNRTDLQKESDILIAQLEHVSSHYPGKKINFYCMSNNPEEVMKLLEANENRKKIPPGISLYFIQNDNFQRMDVAFAALNHLPLQNLQPWPEFWSKKLSSGDRLTHIAEDEVRKQLGQASALKDNSSKNQPIPLGSAGSSSTLFSSSNSSASSAMSSSGSSVSSSVQSNDTEQQDVYTCPW